MAEKLREGKTSFFGSYPQGTDGEKVPIEWEIIRCRDGKVTLLSKYILDVAKGIGDPFDWCEDHFRDAAFDKEEQELLCDLISLPTYNDIAGHFSHYQLVDHERYRLELPIGCFGEELVGTGTEYAVKKGLTVKVFSDEKPWTSMDHRQGYFSEMDEEYRWDGGLYYHGELKDKPVSCYLLQDGRYVDFDTTLRDEEKPSAFFDTGDTVYGIRPVVCIKPSDPEMFEFENIDKFFEIISGWGCWEKEGHFLRSPAPDENIEAFRKEYKERSGSDPVLPEDYIRFLMFSDGLADGPLVMFGTTKFTVMGDYGHEDDIYPLINMNLPMMGGDLLFIGHAHCYEGDHNAYCNIYYDMKEDRYYVDRQSYVTGHYRTECFGFEEAFRKAESIVSDFRHYPY